MKSLFLIAIFGLFVNIASAQTPGQMHQQGATDEKHLHSSGIPNEKGFWDLYGVPESIFNHGKTVDDMYLFTSGAAAGFFLVVLLVLLYFVIFNRQKEGKKAFYTHGTNKGARVVVIGLSILVFVVLDVTALYAYFSHADALGNNKGLMFNPPPEEQALKIQVMPQQWAWNFRYAGVDQKFDTEDDVYTINEMWVPKEKPVVIQVKSRDVIHGFWIPNIRMQVDALPGQITRIWFDSNRTGDFEIVCAHLCGTNHYKMKAFLKVVESDEFDNWHQEMSDWSKVAFDPERPQYRWGWAWGI